MTGGVGPPARSRARVIDQRGRVLFDEELHQRRREHMFAKPRIIATADSSLDFGRGHFEMELGPVVHDAEPSKGETGLQLVFSSRLYVYSSETTINAHRCHC